MRNHPSKPTSCLIRQTCYESGQQQSRETNTMPLLSTHEKTPHLMVYLLSTVKSFLRSIYRPWSRVRGVNLNIQKSFLQAWHKVDLPSNAAEQCEHFAYVSAGQGGRSKYRPVRPPHRLTADHRICCSPVLGVAETEGNNQVFKVMNVEWDLPLICFTNLN